MFYRHRPWIWAILCGLSVSVVSGAENDPGHAKLAAQIFASADKNKDKSLSAEEKKEAERLLTAGLKSAATKHFNLHRPRLREDEVGVFTLADLTAAVEKAESDPDGDGLVSAAEFKQWIEDAFEPLDDAIQARKDQFAAQQQAAAAAPVVNPNPRNVPVVVNRVRDRDDDRREREREERERDRRQQMQRDAQREAQRDRDREEQRRRESQERDRQNRDNERRQREQEERRRDAEARERAEREERKRDEERFRVAPFKK